MSTDCHKLEHKYLKIMLKVLNWKFKLVQTFILNERYWDLEDFFFPVCSEGKSYIERKLNDVIECSQVG